MAYQPNPIDTSKVRIPGELNELVEGLAQNTHDVWAQQRMAEGWTYGPERDDGAKQHPDLVPYANLSESEKEYDRKLVMETLKAMILLGYRVEKA